MGLLLALGLALFAQSSEGPTLRGAVLDPQGVPAPGAEVFLSTREQGTFGVDALRGRVTSDDSGNFALRVPEDWVRRPGWKRLSLWATRAGEGLYAAAYEVPELPVGQELVLQLPGPSGATISVTDPDGEPVAGARVSPGFFEIGRPSQALVDLLAVVTDERGLATPLSWFLSETTSIQVESEEHGLQEFHSREGWPDALELQLLPTGFVEILSESEVPAEFEGLSLELKSYVFPSAETPRGMSVEGRCALPLRAPSAGAPPLLVADRVAPGYLQVPSGVSLLPVVPGGVIETDGVCAIELRWKEGIPVTGRVVDESTHEPVVGVLVQVENFPLRIEVTTDAEGAFRFQANPGFLALRAVQASPDFVDGSDLFAIPRLELPGDAERFELPEIELTRALSVRGRVVDARGHPVPGAWVFGQCRVSANGRQTDTTHSAVADAEGYFRVDGLSPRGSSELGARFGALSTRDPVRVPMGSNAELRLVLSDAGLLPASGVVLDEGGQPVAGAEVVIWRASPKYSLGGEEQVDFGGRKTLTTDAAGAFVGSPGLDSEQRYCVAVQAPGAVEFFSPWFPGAEAREELEYRLRALATVEGRLLDARGAPLAGVRVFVSGDAPHFATTISGDEGRFSLPGVLPRAGLLFCEREDLGFHGRRFEEGEFIEWVVPDEADSSAAAQGPLGPALPREQELQLARRLARRDWEHALETGQRVGKALVRYARVDPVFALREVDLGRLDSSQEADFVRREVALTHMALDPEDALAIAEGIEDGMGSGLTSIEIAAALPAERRARKLEILGLCRARARNLEHPPYRLVILGRLAEALLDLGESAAAREILAEGQEIASQLPAVEWAAFARATFAEELAQVDLPAALELVRAMPRDQRRHLGNIAHELAALDPEAAEELLGRLTSAGGGNRSTYAPRVCYRMATRDLERAQRIADRCGAAGQCYGMLALALAATEPATAKELLATAYHRLEAVARSENQPRGGLGDDVVVAASLLPVVERVDPARLREYVWRTLSLRDPRTPSGQPGREPAFLFSDAALAFYLARYDRELARSLLEPIVVHFRQQGEGGYRSQWRGFYAALAAVDPAWAEELTQELLPGDALGVMSAVLARAGEDRRRYVQDELLNLWIVDKED